jgi:predicted RNA-binding protein (virulence factor B family)
MLQVGLYNQLRVVKIVDFGVYLDGENAGEILLPLRYVPNLTAVDDVLEVFIYRDSEDRLIATTEHPSATIGQVARMRCTQLTNVGAFMDWGLMKDLLVPYSEQDLKAEEGKFYLTYVYLDETTERIVGSFKLRKHLGKGEPPAYNVGDEVNIVVGQSSDLGTNVVVDHQYMGLVYENETFRKLYHGDRLKAYVKYVREDGKIDISLQPIGFDNANATAVERILRALDRANGFLPLTDKTDAEVIQQSVQMSKKSFKKAVGTLYKERKITLEESGIKRVE